MQKFSKSHQNSATFILVIHRPTQSEAISTNIERRQILDQFGGMNIHNCLPFSYRKPWFLVKENAGTQVLSINFILCSSTKPRSTRMFGLEK